jgi:hypothetical protein
LPQFAPKCRQRRPEASDTHRVAAAHEAVLPLPSRPPIVSFGEVPVLRAFAIIVFQDLVFCRFGLFRPELQRHIARQLSPRFLGVIWQKAILADGVSMPMMRLKPEVIECCDAYWR